MFEFFTPKPRVVYFHIGRQLALHNFETGEWVISLYVGNQHFEVPSSYLLTDVENLGDPREIDFDSKLFILAEKFRNGVGFNTDKNKHRKIYPDVCNCSKPDFLNGEKFSEYCVGPEAYGKKTGKE